jgi:hypothetical protein
VWNITVTEENVAGMDDVTEDAFALFDMEL